jgi:predicted nucleotidyltransferase
MGTLLDIAQSNGTAVTRPNTGPFASEPEALGEVLRRLVQDLDPEQIWLFGSRAEGRHRPDSDFDLFVVTRTDSGESGHDYDAVYAPILVLGVGCDVVPYRADDFETARNDRTCLAWHVEHTGKKSMSAPKVDSFFVLADRAAIS